MSPNNKELVVFEPIVISGNPSETAVEPPQDEINEEDSAALQDHIQRLANRRLVSVCL